MDPAGSDTPARGEACHEGLFGPRRPSERLGAPLGDAPGPLWRDDIPFGGYRTRSGRSRAPVGRPASFALLFPGGRGRSSARACERQRRVEEALSTWPGQPHLPASEPEEPPNDRSRHESCRPLRGSPDDACAWCTLWSRSTHRDAMDAAHCDDEEQEPVLWRLHPRVRLPRLRTASPWRARIFRIPSISKTSCSRSTATWARGTAHEHEGRSVLLHQP